MTFTLRTDRQLARAHAASTRFLLATYVAPKAPRRAERLPVSVAFVLDRSGSMAEENKFSLAREAVTRALRMLTPEDRFALVVFDETVDVVVSTSAATPDATRRAIAALSEIQPRGQTDLCSGWLRGCEQLATQLEGEGIARTLLLTDGLANHGTTDRSELTRHAAELRRRGIATSTMGVGEDFDEVLLRDMAHEGGGNFYFIESAERISDVLASELGETMDVVVRGAELKLELPAGARAEVLSRFRSRESAEGGVLTVELGDLVSAQDVRVAIRVRLPVGAEGAQLGVRADLRERGSIDRLAAGSLEWTLASHAANDAQPRDMEVDREVAAMFAARARAEATAANRRGDYRRAAHTLRATAERILSYAGRDAELHRLANELLAFVEEHSSVMSAIRLKENTYVAESAWRGREDGAARRRL